MDIGAVKISKVTAKSKRLDVKMKSLKSAEGYQIMAATDKKFKKNIVKVSADFDVDKVSVTKLKKGRTYYVRARGWRLDSTGKKTYGPWSKTVKKKTK